MFDCIHSNGIFIFNHKSNPVSVEHCNPLVLVLQLPSGDVNPSMPVNVYIYGGAFFEGRTNPHEYNPGYFMNTDMVVVLMNYRLAALG